ncbi:Bacterial transferase hexapeptide family protein [uncultured Spirochaetota bacterium]|jgi:maltose O-acetyltransferase|nr:Bacterial transferase hexapeptide family protein [uncultured Spirochaetota bacterium]
MKSNIICLRKVIGKILFYTIGRFLPSPQFPITPIAYVSKRFRGLCGKLILEKCGKNVNICGRSNFSSRVELGDNSGIGYKANITGKCIIGNNVIMAPECLILTNNHSFSRTDIPIKVQGADKEETVVIGNDVWIGMRVIILPGVKIGNGVVIGAGTVVSKDVPDYSVLVGNPARVVRSRKL